jgi:FMN phosphatase YigB (HAD superfamily)
MYNRALEDLKIRPAEAIFVDDNPRNLEGAYALGIQAVLIDRGRRIPGGFLKMYGLISHLRQSGRAPKQDLKTIWRNPGPFPRISSLDDLESILAE